jgi:VWFA-related protein
LLSFFRKTSRVLFFIAAMSAVCMAQNPFPGEPSQQQQPNQPGPGEQPGPRIKLPPPVTEEQLAAPTIRVNTSVVLVPTLVEKSSGAVLYGLQPKDFTLLDNGVPQNVHVDEDLDSSPVSLVICMQRGRDAALEFDKFARLGPLLELFTGQERGEVALVVFDSKPVYLEGFEKDTTYIQHDLEQLPEGDGGAAILDAAGFSIGLLENQPADRRRVLLLISETRDHGSHIVTIPQLVERIGTSNTLVLSLTFSPSKAELIDWGKGNTNGGTELNLLAPLTMAINAMRKNAPKALASMSGGEYATFTSDKGFENRVAEVASHARNRYMLSFRPTDLTPGLHVIKVSLAENYGARVVTRSSYWAVNDAANVANPAAGTPGAAPASPSP